MAKIGVLLSGCGVYDGAEIHESVLTLLAIDRAGQEYLCLAPDSEQALVVDHLSGEPMAERRNVLTESARIARGQIENLAQVRAADLDALILPGGFGAARNLSTFGVDGAQCSIHEDVARLIREVHAQGKPVGALCIAPAVLARAFNGDLQTKLTIGRDRGTAQAIQKLGAKHVDCPVDGIVIDEANRVVTTPCYMLAQRISEAAVGIDKLVAQIVTWIASPVSITSPVSVPAVSRR